MSGTKIIPLDLKALHAEALEPDEPQNDPSIFTTAEYARENDCSESTARRMLDRLLAKGRVKRASKWMLRDGSHAAMNVPAWTLTKADES